jgi:hypothetical protein
MARRWRLTSPRCSAVRLKAPREAAGLFFSYHIHSPIFLLHRSDVFRFSKPDSRHNICFTGLLSGVGGEDGIVLNNLSEQVRECLQHAEHCARQAAAQTDPKLKQDFLVMERRWLFLARSYEFSERLTRQTKRQADNLPKRSSDAGW